LTRLVAGAAGAHVIFIAGLGVVLEATNEASILDQIRATVLGLTIAVFCDIAVSFNGATYGGIRLHVVVGA